MAGSSEWNKHFFFNPANFSVLSYGISSSFPVIYQNNTWIVSLFPSFKNMLKKKKEINQRKRQGKWKSEIGSDVESGDVTNLHIIKIFRRNKVKNTPEIYPTFFEYIILLRNIQPSVSVGAVQQKLHSFAYTCCFMCARFWGQKDLQKALFRWKFLLLKTAITIFSGIEWTNLMILKASCCFTFTDVEKR